MTAQAVYLPYISAQDYLAGEAGREFKHEYIDGEIYAMAGARETDVTTSLNVAAALKAHLRGTPCRPFVADLKLRVEASNAFFYPDVFVSCGERVQADYRSDAVLVVEVLSPSTAAFDRGAKFAHYRQLPGLREYLLIAPETRSADLYPKGEDGLWVLHPYVGNDKVELGSVGLALPLADVIFEDVEPEPPPVHDTPPCA
ncbi:MAG: Uma2 family endonuclease [Halothiobacillaceae bacterium]|nr:Uma2 family endonuclease [Halothiobacillaceae bacterium]